MQTSDGNVMNTKKPPVNWATNTLCVLLILVWVLEVLDVTGIFPTDIVSRLSFLPMMGLFEPWRFLTAAFLHSYPLPIHLAFNTWALWVVGRALEPVLGHLRTLVAFLICAYGAMLAQCLIALVNAEAWLTPTVGASGAVFGFFGMVLAIQKTLRLPWTQMATLIVINFVLGFVLPNIAWVAHLGGLLVGLVLGFYTGWTLKHAKYTQIIAAEGTATIRKRVVTWKDSLRDAAFYFMVALVLLVFNWIFYHFNYQVIYTIIGNLSS